MKNHSKRKRIKKKTHYQSYQTLLISNSFKLKKILSLALNSNIDMHSLKYVTKSKELKRFYFEI